MFFVNQLYYNHKEKMTNFKQNNLNFKMCEMKYFENVEEIFCPVTV